MMRIKMVFLSIILFSGAAEADVQSLKKPDFNDLEALETYRQDLFSIYSQCSDAAEVRRLSRDEVDACSFVFLKLKLSFLNGVTVERYATMKPSLRATANRKGYDSYRAWLHRHRADAAILQ